MEPEIETLHSQSGASLAFRHWRAEAPRAALIICHGLGEHGGRHRGLAEAMAKHGIAALAHDHRGHGLTAAPDAPRGRFAWRGGAEKVVADVLAMRAHAEGLYRGLPVFLFGHSMGGLIALNVAMEAPERFAGVAAWNMNAVPGAFAIGLARFVLKAERALKGSDVPADLVPRLTLETWNAAMPERRTSADWLSRDPAEVDAFLADPLCGNPASVSLWLDLFDLMAGWRTRSGFAAARALPFFLLGGGSDPGTEGGKAITRLAQTLRRDGFSRVKASIYPAARHETLHDLDREAALAELAAWCEACLAEME